MGDSLPSRPRSCLSSFCATATRRWLTGARQSTIEQRPRCLRRGLLFGLPARWPVVLWLQRSPVASQWPASGHLIRSDRGHPPSALAMWPALVCGNQFAAGLCERALLVVGCWKRAGESALSPWPQEAGAQYDTKPNPRNVPWPRFSRALRCRNANSIPRRRNEETFASTSS